MSKLLFRSLLFSPVVMGAALVASGSAIAAEAKPVEASVKSEASALQVETLNVAPEAPQAEVAPVFADKQPTTVAEVPAAQPSTDASSLNQINRYSREGRRASQDQVTSVSQLTDVRPTDWAFQALQSLVERYGCIVGYPDRTFRGNRAMTRYEFAAGLNACLDRINELIAAATADAVKKEDLEALQRLQEEFAAELATLRGRVDALEARTATLEKQQFSTTTKLAGEVIFQVSDEFGFSVNNEPVFQDRVRLNFNTSFTGEDLLVTRLDAGNGVRFRQPGNEGTMMINFGDTGSNDIVLGWLAYYFPIGDGGTVYVPAAYGLWYDFVPTNAGLMEDFDGGQGPISIFAQRNPIYLIGGGSGVGATVPLGPVKVSLGYMADTGRAQNPASGNGLFDGSYAAMGQITYETDTFSVGVTYLNGFRKDGDPLFNVGAGNGASFVGSGLDNPTSIRARNALYPALGGQQGTTVNAYGISASVLLNSKISINGYFSYIDADFLRDGIEAGEYWTFGGGVAFADLGKRGNLLGIFAGVQPYLGNARSFGVAGNDMPVSIEAFYRYRLTDNISITPGLMYVINPGQRSGNSDVFIGTLRTTFTF